MTVCFLHFAAVRRVWRAVGLLLLAACALPAGAAVTRLYPGSTAPCASTLQACIDGAAADDTILLANGTANTEVLTIRRSLTLQTVLGGSASVGTVIVYNDATALITIQGVTTRDIRAYAGTSGDLDVRVSQSDVTSFHFRAPAAPTSGQTFRVVVFDNRFTRPADLFCGIGIQNERNGATVESMVRRNTIVNNDCPHGISAGVTNAAAATVRIDSNRISGAPFNEGITVDANGAGSTLNAEVLNNLVTGQVDDSGRPGAVVVHASRGTVHAEVTNNTLVGNSTGIYVWARTDLGGVVTGAARNNLIANNSEIGLSVDPAIGFSNAYNLLFNNGTGGSTPAPGPGTRTGDPAFVNAAGGDFRLTAASGAINHGLDSALPSWLTTDLQPAPRYVGSIDIGAYEFQTLMQPAVGLACAPTALVDAAGNEAVCTVTASAPAPASGLNVGLVLPPASARYTTDCPASVLIAAGATTAPTCRIVATPNTTPGDGTVSATLALAAPDATAGYTLGTTSSAAVSVGDDDGPAGPGPGEGAGVTPVPTLGEWALTLLALAAAGLGAHGLRRRGV